MIGSFVAAISMWQNIRKKYRVARVNKASKSRKQDIIICSLAPEPRMFTLRVFYSIFEFSGTAKTFMRV